MYEALEGFTQKKWLGRRKPCKSFRLSVQVPMAKPMNMQRRIKALENAGPIKTRDPVALAMALRGGQGRHKDHKKDQSRRACRGKLLLDG
jgi:hypothetical protein